MRSLEVRCDVVVVIVDQPSAAQDGSSHVNF
jgi:hypothetical protein